MKEILELLQEWKDTGAPADIINRDLKIAKMEKKANSFVGIRRAGKTYAMFQLAKGIKSKDVFYINMEDDRLVNPNIKHLTALTPTIKENFELKGKQLYLFVDEIQNVDNWERWARRMAERKDVFLFISGSSSKLSSQEIATALRGRTITNYIFPLNFREFLKFKGFYYDAKTIGYSTKRFELKRLFNEYLKYGGFPEVVLAKKKEKLKLLREYFATIIARDIVERFKIENVTTLESFMKLLLHNYSRFVSFSKAEKWLASMGIKTSKATLIEYFNYIKQSFFIFNTGIFSYKIKERLQYPIKVYVTDNGFIEALTQRFSRNVGWLYENLVAIELFKKCLDNPSNEIYYWKDKQGKEVDFIVKQGLKVKELIQVCYDIEDLEIKKREVQALLKAGKELRCRNLLVVTEDFEGKEKIAGKEIRYVPLWFWLLKAKAGHM
jgi:hypothetical protein